MKPCVSLLQAAPTRPARREGRYGRSGSVCTRMRGPSPRGGVQTLGQTERAGGQHQAERAAGANNRLAGGDRAQRKASGPEHERSLVRYDGLIGEQDARDLREGQPGKQTAQASDPGTGAAWRG